MTQRTILVTSALPYANGPLHLGHMLETIQTDIWVRFQRLCGQRCYYVCADDAHGTPIMLRAEDEGISPEALIARIYGEHLRDLTTYAISLDNFYTTHSPENRHFAELIYLRLEEGGFIACREIEQSFDAVKGMFLPDRFIRGTCPRCKTPGQHGDSCEHCGATYNPMELQDAVSVLSGTSPVLRRTEHHFVRLGAFEAMLRQWLERSAVQEAVRHKLMEWFTVGLADWDISRDSPYFGFEIPRTVGKYFYVWLDAPIGYMASFQNLCTRQRELDFESFWGPESTAELYHFIGKDIIYFHCLFWPAMLHGAGFRTPSGVFAHGFLTVDGQKMSKSRGTFIEAQLFAKHLDPQMLRYYFASKLSAAVEDIDLNLDEMLERCNADIVGKLVNIPARLAPFLERHAGGLLAPVPLGDPLWSRVQGAAQQVAQHYEAREYAAVVRLVMACADQVNQFIQEQAPWRLEKQGDTGQVLHIASLGIQCFRLLMLYLKPIVPHLAAEAERFLQIAPLRWDDIHLPLGDHVIQPYSALARRLERAAVQELRKAALAQGGQGRQAAPPQSQPVAPPAPESGQDHVDIQTFGRIDLRVARILEASTVPESDKLLRLVVDLGSEQRQIFAGIKGAYPPETLVGRLCVIVANLKPRTMRFGVSEGMVLAAGDDGPGVFLLAPDSGAVPGMRVR